MSDGFPLVAEVRRNLLSVHFLRRLTRLQLEKAIVHVTKYATAAPIVPNSASCSGHYSTGRLVEWISEAHFMQRSWWTKTVVPTLLKLPRTPATLRLLNLLAKKSALS